MMNILPSARGLTVLVTPWRRWCARAALSSSLLSVTATFGSRCAWWLKGRRGAVRGVRKSTRGDDEVRSTISRAAQRRTFLLGGLEGGGGLVGICDRDRDRRRGVTMALSWQGCGFVGGENEGVERGERMAVQNEGWRRSAWCCGLCLECGRVTLDVLQCP